MQKSILWSTWLRFLIVTLLVLSVFFRFANVDQKAYTTDEVRSLLRSSGFTSQELIDQVFNGGIIGVEDLHKYQRPNPGKSVIDTIKALPR